MSDECLNECLSAGLWPIENLVGQKASLIIKVYIVEFEFNASRIGWQLLSDSARKGSMSQIFCSLLSSTHLRRIIPRNGGRTMILIDDLNEIYIEDALSLCKTG